MAAYARCLIVYLPHSVLFFPEEILAPWVSVSRIIRVRDASLQLDALESIIHQRLLLRLQVTARTKPHGVTCVTTKYQRLNVARQMASSS